MVPAAFVPIPFNLKVRAGFELAEGVAADGLGEGVEPVPGEAHGAAMRSRVAIATTLLKPEIPPQVCPSALPVKVTCPCGSSILLTAERGQSVALPGGSGAG